MTSSTDEYFPVFMNWLVYFHQICPSVANIYFICLDTVIEKKLGDYGLTCAHTYHVSSAHADIWLVRTRLTHSLLAQGYDVLLTDSDALWLHNPFPLIEQHLTSDIVSSRGSYPENVSKKLGAALCMGFVYIKASEHTVALWGEAAAHMARQTHPDDQKDINTLLLTLGLHYATTPTYLGSTTYNQGYFQHHNHNYRVTLLPHVLFRRLCDQERAADLQASVVAHCLSHVKKGASKVSTAEAMGLWRLRPQWERVALHGDLLAYLDAISTFTAGTTPTPNRNRNSNTSMNSSSSKNTSIYVGSGNNTAGPGGRGISVRDGREGVTAVKEEGNDTITSRVIRALVAAVAGDWLAPTPGGVEALMRGSHQHVRVRSEEGGGGGGSSAGDTAGNSEGSVGVSAERSPLSTSVTITIAPRCAEYSRNRRLFRSPGGRDAHTCWYVSSSAPEDVARQFEEEVSRGS